MSSNEKDADGFVRVGCATSSLDSISIFGRRSNRNGATMDLDTLERILTQDAPEYATKNRYSGNSSDSIYDKVKYCGLTENGYRNLKNAIDRKSLSKEKICIPYDRLIHEARRGFISVSGGESSSGGVVPGADKSHCDWYKSLTKDNGCFVEWDKDDARCTISSCCYFDENDPKIKKIQGCTARETEAINRQAAKNVFQSAAKMNVSEKVQAESIELRAGLVKVLGAGSIQK